MNKDDFKQLKELLDYDSDTGLFTWRISPSNSIKKKQVAGTKNTNGHIQIKVFGKRYFAHRLAWLFTNGNWPPMMIDHINGIRDDNRIANLRQVTASENGHNQTKPHSRTKSGYLGVSWIKSRNKWQAGLGINGKYKFLGYFDDAKSAHAEYLRAKKIHHPSAPVN
jgi:hypothetical protein